MNFVSIDAIDKVHCRGISFRWRHNGEYQFCTVSDRMAPMGTEGCPFYGLLQLSVGLLSLSLLQPFCPAELATDIVFFFTVSLSVVS